MAEYRTLLANEIILSAPNEGLNETPIPGVYCIKFSRAGEKAKGQWRTSLVIIAQGRKQLSLEENVYRYEEAHYIATPIDLPIATKVISATPERPYLALRIEFSLAALSEVAASLPEESSKEIEMNSHGLFSGKADDKMLEAAIRLMKLSNSPEDAKFLAPLIIREMIYHLLRGENGPALRQFTRSGHRLQKISQTIHKLRSDLDEDIDVQLLAREVGMSRATFFRHFKEATAMTPIQYQKQLRLFEARRLLVESGESAEGAAYQVGYKSASQFSREYSRMFGHPPLRDTTKFLKTARPRL